MKGYASIQEWVWHFPKTLIYLMLQLKGQRNNGDKGYVLLSGCVVWEASQAWLAIVCAVSKLPMKRIISGNNHWCCLLWLMATSQYLTSHRLHQTYSQMGMWRACAVAFVCHTFSGYVLVIFAKTWSDNRPLKEAALQCALNRLLRSCVYGQRCQPLLVMPVPSLSFPSSSFHSSFLSRRAGDVLHRVVGTCGLTAHQSQEKLNVVCPCKRMIPWKQW